MHWTGQDDVGVQYMSRISTRHTGLRISTIVFFRIPFAVCSFAEQRSTNYCVSVRSIAEAAACLVSRYIYERHDLIRLLIKKNM